MEWGDWLTLAAVIVALSIGVSSIIQTSRIRKQDRKEAILREIIDWASEIVESRTVSNLPVTPDAVGMKPEDENKLYIRVMESNAFNTAAHLTSPNARAKRIQYIAERHVKLAVPKVDKVCEDLPIAINDCIAYARSQDANKNNKYRDTLARLVYEAGELMASIAELKFSDVNL
jgi:hypothetical protein